jgi:hypothetical protein
MLVVPAGNRCFKILADKFWRESAVCGNDKIEKKKKRKKRKREEDQEQ